MLEFVTGMAKMVGMDIAAQKGDRLPDEAFEALSAKMKQRLGDPNDVAKAVLYAVTQPIEVNIADLVVRPPKSPSLPH